MTDAVAKIEKAIEARGGIALTTFEREVLRRESGGAKNYLLLDDSGSMSSETNTPGERRIDALRSVVYGIKQQGIHFVQVVFNNNAFVSDMIPEPSGGTNMAEAFDVATDARHIVVVSDGEPNSKPHALEAAQRAVDRGCLQIDAYYVGPNDAYMSGCKEFMEALTRLAPKTGSTGAVSFKELGVKIAGALAADNSAPQASGPIAL